MRPDSGGGSRKKPSLLLIDDVLTRDLAPQFASIEALRRSVVLRLVIVGALALPALVFVFLSSGRLQDKAGLVQFVVVGSMALGAWFVRHAKKAFVGAFKDQVMRPVAKRFFPELRYDPERFLGKHRYDESQLFRAELTTFTGNDHFSGRLGEVDFEFSELLCQYTTGSGKNRQTHTAFRGFYFVGDFHRDFYFRTTIRPDTAEKLLGVLGRGLQRIGAGKNLVDLEDPEFEKLFVVTSDDQVEARYILTPVFMEKLREFRQKVGNDIHLAFVNGKMHLAIPTGHDYFEPRLFGPILERRDLMKFIDMLGLLIGVAEEFLHHPKFGANPPVMPHPPLPVGPVTPPPPPPRRVGVPIPWLKSR